MRLSSIRRLALVVGALVCGYGLAVLTVPSLAVDLPLSTPIVALVGLFAFVAAGVGLYRRSRQSRPLPNPPGRVTYRLPGDSWRDRLAATSAADTDARRALRDEITEVAVAAIASDGTPPETAHERIQTGAWTDDDLAAAYLRDEPVAFTERVRALLGGPAPFRRRARRAMAVVADEWEDGP